MAIHGASSSSSSSSASISQWDVFLSFRGKDTRKNFTAHLCATLRQKGIHTFMDDKLKSGEEISPELIKAIEGSKISIIVFSKNYVSSRWCLDELMKILECRKTREQHVLPLFYDIDPSEVRNQTTSTSVGEAFAKLEKMFKDDVTKVKEWKAALKEVADLSGKHLDNYRNEPEFIREIIEWVNSILGNKTYFQVAEYPIQMESRVQYVKSLLDIEKNDNTCMVGIFGTGGIGQELGYVSKILDKCGSSPDDGIKVLVNKSLISIDDEKYYDEYSPRKNSYRTILEMHDLLQEMGREIVRQESPKEPGKRSRLWYHEDVCHVLEGDTGTNKVEGILINLPKHDPIHLNSKAFKKMKRLRLFISHDTNFFEEPNFLSNDLRLLHWRLYPRNSLPSNFSGKNLVVLRMPQSRLKRLEGLQKFPNLTTMDFSCCICLENIPDVSRIPNLESLVVDFCNNLVEIHHSVGFLDKLVLLSARECYSLSIFPTSLKLRSLKSLFVSDCLDLQNFPEIKCQMKCLENIDFNSTGIKELPSSIKYFVGVKMLHLFGCTNLMHLPDSIDQLQHLKILDLTNCEQLRDILRLPPNVVEVDASGCVSLAIFLEEGRRSQLLNTWDPPEPVGVRTASPALRLSNLGNNVVKESEFSIHRNCPSSLKVLDLSGSAIVSLPTCFNRFVGLEKLHLNDCEQLRDILRLPPNVVEVEAWGCVSLEIFLEEPRGAASPALQSDFLIQIDCPSSLKVLNLSHSAIVSLPAWLNKFVGLEELYLYHCKQLKEIPELPPNIKMVDAQGCTSLEKCQFNNINDLPMLEWIDFSDCHKLRENMGDGLQIGLMSKGHAKDHEFTCIFPGNNIPDCLSHCKEVSNANSCEIDINEPLHLDSGDKRFVFSTVIRTEYSYLFKILVEVINNGQRIYFHRSRNIWNSVDSDHVYLHYPGSHHSQLKMDNLRVLFTFETGDAYFKSCGFHH